MAFLLNGKEGSLQLLPDFYLICFSFCLEVSLMSAWAEENAN